HISNAPLVTNAKQTVPTNMAAYLRNRRPESVCGGASPVPAPGWSVEESIRSVRQPGRDHSMPAVSASERIFIRSALRFGGRGKLRQMLFLQIVVYFPVGAILSRYCVSSRMSERGVHFIWSGRWMAIEIGRRKFITLLGSTLAAQAIPANAQELRVRTVGVLMGFANDAEAKARVEAFEKGLETEGWPLGQNLRIEYRYAEGDSARMQALAKELVELKPGCILG